MAATRTSNEALLCLVAAAVALPSMSASAADPNVRSDSVALSYDHSFYGESGGRMHARTAQLSGTVPLGDRYQVRIDAVRDITSGASPYSNRVVGGEARQVLSKATIHDQRDEQDVTGSYYGDNSYYAIKLGHSSEHDYISNYLNASYRRYFNEKATALILGTTFSRDKVWDKYYPSNPYSHPAVYEHRRGQRLTLGLSQILDVNSIVQFVLSRDHDYGYLNSQYRRANLFIGGVNSYRRDTRPGKHTQWTAVASYSHYFPGTHSAMHLQYRYAYDSWGADSHTVEGKWRFDLGKRWFLSPGLRYYAQTNARFYNVYFTQAPGDGYMSSDYRLAAFGTISPSLELAKSFSDNLTLRISYQRYMRRYSWKLGSGRGASLDNFHADVVSLSVQGVF